MDELDGPEGEIPMPRTWGMLVTKEAIYIGVSIKNLFIYPYIL